MPESNQQEIFDNEGRIDYDKVVEIVHINLKNFLNAILDESFSMAGDRNYRTQINETTSKISDQALDTFLERKHIVSSEFYVELESRFYTSYSGIMRSQTINQDGIQTMDTDLIELALAIDTLINRSVDRHSGLIDQLILQLEELSFLSHQEFNTHCLHPQDFYKLFQNCIVPLNIPADGKILISKLLYQNISPNLNDFYLAMRKFLLDIGIQPNESSKSSGENKYSEKAATDSSIMSMTTGQFFAPVEQKMWNQEFEAQHDPVSDQLNKQAEILNTEKIDEIAMDVYGPGQTGLDETTIGLLLQPYSPGTQSNSSPAQRRQFVRALSRVQQVEAASNAVFKANQIKTAVRRTLHEKGALDAVEIVDNEEKVIDFVSNIFQVILEDDSLCDAMKALLARLQISTIKLALIDFTFFQNSKHPARQLLNKLTSIGVSVSGKEEELFKKLKLIIKNITDNFETDVKVFDHALHDINKLDSQTLNDAIKQANEQNNHQLRSQRSAAKRIVIHTIKKFTRKKEIPNPMLEFCLKCWAPHMAYVYMNHGRSTKEWRNSVRTLRRLLEVSQGNHSLNEVNRYIHEPKDFFENIRVELEHFSNHNEEFEEVLEGAEVWYLTYLRKIQQESEETAQQEQNTNEENVETENVEQQDNVIHLFKNLTSVPDTAEPTFDSEGDAQNQETTEDVEKITIEDHDAVEGKSTESVHEGAIEADENDNSERTEDSDETEEDIPENIDSVDQFDSEMEFEEGELDEEPELSVEEHLPESIVPGVWLEIFQGENKAKRRLKFSNADSENKLLYFTDRSGDYRFEIDLETFLDDLSTGRSNLISESNRFDLALSSVINDIRTSQDKAGSS